MNFFKKIGKAIMGNPKTTMAGAATILSTVVPVWGPLISGVAGGVGLLLSQDGGKPVASEPDTGVQLTPAEREQITRQRAIQSAGYTPEQLAEIWNAIEERQKNRDAFLRLSSDAPTKAAAGE